MIAKRASFAVVALLVAALVAPTAAGAQKSDQQRRDEAAAAKIAAAAELDVLKARDDELESAVNALDEGIAVQSSTTEAARQAADAADVALDSAEAKLAATEANVADLQQKAADVAVRSYMNPTSGGIIDIVRSADLSDGSRRQTLLSHVVSSERDVLGELREAREDLVLEQENLAVLRDEAESRRAAAQAKLDELVASRSEQQRLRGALDERIRAYQAEVDAHAREEAQLTALIRERQRQAAAAATAAGASPVQVSPGGMVWPVNGTITSPFGMRWGRMHQGVDIAAPAGTPIKAAKAGRVILAGYNGGYGNTVIIDHGGGFSTLYAHQSRLGVADGATVGAGQVIGYVGTTGNSTGNHLHYETRVNGVARNPMAYY